MRRPAAATATAAARGQADLRDDDALRRARVAGDATTADSLVFQRRGQRPDESTTQRRRQPKSRASAAPRRWRSPWDAHVPEPPNVRLAPAVGRIVSSSVPGSTKREQSETRAGDRQEDALDQARRTIRARGRAHREADRGPSFVRAAPRARRRFATLRMRSAAPVPTFPNRHGIGV